MYFKRKSQILIGFLVIVGILGFVGISHVSILAQTPVPENSALEVQILQTIQAYNEKAAEFAFQPGWLMIAFDQESYIQYSSPKPLPAKHREEYWFLLDENRNPVTMVEFLISDETGKVALGITQEGQTISFWNEETYQEEPYLPSIDLYLESSLDEYISYDVEHTVSLKTEKLNDAESDFDLIELVASYPDSQPISVYAGMETRGRQDRYWIDPNTGLLQRYEHAFVLVDGSIQ